MGGSTAMAARFVGMIALGGTALALSVPLGSCGRAGDAPDTPVAPIAAPQSPGAGGGSDVVLLCDGHTSTRIPHGAPINRTTGQALAADLMSQWTARHPERGWAPDPDPAHTIVAPADNRGVIAMTDAGITQGLGHSYGSYSAQEVFVWQRELERQVAAGDRVFHSADELGSTIAVSCDMCHPNAANTHPETYPKFQVQLGRVVLLRDMINWCLEHPVRAPAMTAEDPRMRAMEMYIFAQRRGVALNYGRH